MNTSKTIKQGQSEKHQVSRIGLGVFQTQSRDGSHQHTVRRNHDRFTCDCPSRSLCHHIIDVLTASADKRGKVVSFWTSQEDAERQKKRTQEYRASGKAFWVTFKTQSKPDPVAELDAEIAQVGQAIADARHRKLMTNDPNIRVPAQAEKEKLYEKLNALTYQRERAVVQRMVA